MTIGDLIAEQHRLHTKLNNLWEWLDDNPDDPKTQARLNVFDSTLATYVKVCDRIDKERNTYGQRELDDTTTSKSNA